MALETILDGILDSRTKLRIIRFFASRTEAFTASGREIAKWTALSPPAAHAALKDLLDRKVLKREILGKQHLYRLDRCQPDRQGYSQTRFSQGGRVQGGHPEFPAPEDRGRGSGTVKSFLLFYMEAWLWEKPMRPATATSPSWSSTRRLKSGWKNSFRTGS